MTKILGVLILLLALFVMFRDTIVSDNGTFGDAKTQRDRAHAISDNTTVPSIP